MNKSVSLYTTPTCPWCIKAKQFLKENNIEFKSIDVSSDKAAAEEMIKKSGQMNVPVLDIDGEIIVGLDKERIKALLSL